MTLALTGCSWCYDNGFVLKLYEIGVGAGSCSNASVHFRRRLRCKLSRLKRAGELYETGSDWMFWVLCHNGFVFKHLFCYVTTSSCSNSSVQLQKEDIERLRCKLSRLKKAMTFGFMFKQRCSAQEGGHRTPEM